MLEKIKSKCTNKDLLQGNIGVERESLRVNYKGDLSKQDHPLSFGNKMNNPYITTDFSESQVEVITPPLSTPEEVYNSLSSLYDIVSMEIGEEYLWPQSMPAIVPDDKDIPIAKYDNSEEGVKARLYRETLISKYGGRKQLISGIHYNFSFKEDFIEKLYDGVGEYKEFKNNLYLKMTRNYLRYRWLIIYLLGATSTVHTTYYKDCDGCLNKISDCTFSSKGALSYRNDKCGYKNVVDLFPSYESVTKYIESIKSFVNDKLIAEPKELYSQVRLKAKNKEDILKSLEEDGISYLEYRSIDINPFDKCGISLKDLTFLQLFNIYLLVKEESDYKSWQEEALENQHVIARKGRNDVNLLKDGSYVSKKEWALEILEEIKSINKELNLNKENIIDEMIEKINNHKLTYAYKIYKKVKEEGYIQAHLNLAKDYKKDAFNNRFKLHGYEDLELSTQILIKEAIKRGIKVELTDRQDNFICLTKDDNVQYIKQATKTSIDNYVTVLIMENKTVTKKVLRKSNIKVPEGMEFKSFEEAKENASRYVSQSVVIKPKSTNFGLGISIFKDGATEEELIKAFEIAFKHDNTVLLEEFIPGKEYRFLVIDDKVVGILHRVPANVVGDGVNSIRKLVELKNQDPLRGKGYKTPLEKIKLDDNAALFLSNQNKDFNYIPLEGETVYLRENSNISTGGDSIDYTDLIPNKFKDIAVKCAKAVNAKICGVDIMLEDYSNENSNYGIIELNFNPAIHIHCFPYKGTERNIGVEVLKLLNLA